MKAGFDLLLARSLAEKPSERRDAGASRDENQRYGRIVRQLKLDRGGLHAGAYVISGQKICKII